MKKLNKSRFLEKLAPAHTHADDGPTVEAMGDDTADLSSFCGNSDLFSMPSIPVAPRHLSKEEFQRQARFYRS